MVDNLLNKGVVLDGEVVLALADVDLIYLKLSVLLSAADRVLAGQRPLSSRSLKKNKGRPGRPARKGRRR